ncbi:MAG: type II toxin-antitoxin system VapC family toxin [Gemmobacter sp.]
MIVVDTSAIVAMLQAEATEPALRRALREASAACMCAGSLTECMIVAGKRGLHRLALRLIRETPIEIVPLDEARARFAGEVYLGWGKGNHPANLNFGDCFAYALAKTRDLPLLYVGDDFAQTDVRSAVVPG